MLPHTCPVWVGYFLISPIRKLYQNPNAILGSYVNKGMQVLDVGCAMGYFSLPLAKMVGENGLVTCVDFQEVMLNKLSIRAADAGVMKQINLHRCAGNSLMLRESEDKYDFALAFAMVHEVSNQRNFFNELHSSLKTGAKLLICEPKFHVSRDSFDKMIDLAKQNGYSVAEMPKVAVSHSVLLQKN